ncbi:MAG TPA: methyltransferase [Stellaceae bacterium]|nr:methyltransferase [Stellaceae bacterium]
MRIRAVIAMLLLAAAPGLAAATPSPVALAVADPSRPADDRKLDADRKPVAVLAFAGIKPGQTVAEYLPGGGYYTRLLDDIVGPKGKIDALETTTWGQDNVDSTKKVLAEPNRGNISLDLSPLGTFKLTEKVDVFWTTDNYHDLHVPKYATVDIAAFNKQVFDSLKPGGIYIIVDHAAAPGAGATMSPTLHRIEKSTVIQEVTAAGFKLVGESDALANPADDHTKKIFDPSIRWKTDQFILKFAKP